MTVFRVLIQSAAFKEEAKEQVQVEEGPAAEMGIAEKGAGEKEAFECNKSSLTIMIPLKTRFFHAPKKELIVEDEFANIFVGERARVFCRSSVQCISIQQTISRTTFGESWYDCLVY